MELLFNDILSNNPTNTSGSVRSFPPNNKDITILNVLASDTIIRNILQLLSPLQIIDSDAFGFRNR